MNEAKSSIEFHSIIDHITNEYKNINDVEIKKTINNLYDSFAKESELTSVPATLHYLFDGYINNKIGNSSENMTLTREFLKLNDYFDLKFENYTSVSVSNHATVFYKFEHQKRKYIYYSNGGFGSHNHILINDLIVPKVY